MTKEEKIKTEELLSILRRVNMNIRKNNPNTEALDGSLGDGPSTKEYQKLIEDGVPHNFIIPFYHFFGYSLKWKSTPESGVEASGSIKILKLPEVFGDWEGQTYFQDTPEESTLRDFKPVDVRDEFCDTFAGIYFGKNKTDYTFHYGDIDGSEYQSLDLDINGYIEMMIMAKGCYGWQSVIAYELHGGYKLGGIDDFKENMPKLFPEWTWEGFVKKFEEVRLNKVK